MGEQPREENDEEVLESLPLDKQEMHADEDDDQIIVLDHDKETGDEFLLHKLELDGGDELDAFTITEQEGKNIIRTRYLSRMEKLREATHDTANELGITDQEELDRRVETAQQERDELSALQQQETNYRLTPAQQDRAKVLQEKLAQGQPDAIILSLVDKKKEIIDDQRTDLQNLKKHWGGDIGSI